MTIINELTVRRGYMVLEEFRAWTQKTEKVRDSGSCSEIIPLCKFLIVHTECHAAWCPILLRRGRGLVQGFEVQAPLLFHLPSWERHKVLFHVCAKSGT